LMACPPPKMVWGVGLVTVSAEVIVAVALADIVTVVVPIAIMVAPVGMPVPVIA